MTSPNKVNYKFLCNFFECYILRNVYLLLISLKMNQDEYISLLVKEKLSLSLTKRHAMRTYWRVEI